MNAGERPVEDRRNIQYMRAQKNSTAARLTVHFDFTTVKHHYYLFICDILFHNVTQFRCCFMSDDRVRLHAEASVVQFSSSIVFFFGNSVQKMCTNTPDHIPVKTRRIRV